MRWGLIRRQMAVQLRVATVNPWTLLLFVIQPAAFVAVGMLLSRARPATPCQTWCTA